MIDSTEEYEKYINLQASFRVIITELPSCKKFDISLWEYHHGYGKRRRRLFYC